MRFLIQRVRFRRDYKLQKRRGKNIAKLEKVVQILTEDSELPVSYQPHKLSGEYQGLWECHIEPDWLLVYCKTNTDIIFERIGSHSDLFK